MIYYILSALINAITSTVLGVFVYTRNRKSRKNITFLIFCITIAEWNYAYYVWLLCEQQASALFWARTLMVGAIFISSAFFHYVLEFLELNHGRKRALLICSYIADFLIVLFAYSPALVAGTSKKMFFNYWPDPGPLFYVFSLKVLVFAIYSNAILYKAYKSSHGLLSYQRKLTFWAGVMGYVGGIPVLPLWFNIPVLPVTHITVSFFMIIFAYAIVQYRLLDIEVLIKKTLVFTGLLIALFTMLILPTLFIQEYLFRNTGFGEKMAGLAISGIVIILTMRRIESLLVNITDKYLFQKRYDYRELLKTFTSEVLTVLDLNKLIDLTTSKLREVVRLESCRVELFIEGKERPTLPLTSFEANADRTELAIPIILRNNVIGRLQLGKKKSDNLYTQDDLDILLPLTKTLAIAISNAHLFEEIGKTQAEAAHKEKMAIMGTLAAGMAHEIRNPITTIKIFSDYLPDKIDEEGFASKYKSIVVKEVDKIDHVIQTMIDFSEDAIPNEIENVSLSVAIDELVTFMNSNLGLARKVEFIKDISPLLPDICVNRKEFDEIMLNLTQNAINAIEKNGSITFQAKEGVAYIELVIKDTGCGMSEDTLKYIFKPFFTTRSEGFGLGLFVVNDLIKRNNGNIAVESKLGVGTAFRLEFQKACESRAQL